jgi:hypothetical protein
VGAPAGSKEAAKAAYRSDPGGGPDAKKEQNSCAERIFTNLTRRAYRRPVTSADVQTAMAFYLDARQNGETFDAGIRAGLARVLSSPSFLYRMESDPAGVRPGTAHPVSDVDLASRLSFFLWSSIPDDRLLNLATSGRIHQPGVLTAEVKRMIADPRADSGARPKCSSATSSAMTAAPWNC